MNFHNSKQFLLIDISDKGLIIMCLIVQNIYETLKKKKKNYSKYIILFGKKKIFVDTKYIIYILE